MKTKIKLLLMVLMMGTVVSLSAQNRSESAEDMAKREADRLNRELSLNADQQKKVQDITLKYAKKKKDMKDDKRMEDMTEQQRKTMKDNMKRDMDAKDAEMKGVLTATQYDKYMGLKDEMKNEHKRNK